MFIIKKLCFSQTTHVEMFIEAANKQIPVMYLVSRFRPHCSLQMSLHRYKEGISNTYWTSPMKRWSWWDLALFHTNSSGTTGIHSHTVSINCCNVRWCVVSVVQDLKGSVVRIAQFLEKLLDAVVIEKITDRCLFKNMEQNKMSNKSTAPREVLDQTKNKFLRKGEIQ